MAKVIAVTVDLECDADIATQTIEFPSDICWSDFELMLRLAYDLDSVLVKYVDEDDDEVTISSNEELKEAFRVAQMQLNTLQLKLFSPRSPAVMEAPRSDPLRCDSPPRRLPLPGVAKPISTTAPLCSDVSGVTSSSASAASSDESVTMEVMESSKDTGSSPDSPKVQCFMVRHISSGLVLDVEAWSRTPGTRVILWNQKRGCGHHWTDWSCENQLFVEDEETGTIRSYLCGLCLDATETGITLQPFNADRETQKWKVVGNRLQNGPNNANWVIGLADGAANASAQPIAMTYQANASQHWAIEFVDEGLLTATGGRESGSKGHRLFKELATEMAKQMSSASEESAGPEGSPPTWFTAYMDKFKHDICEEISTLVTRKTVRQVLAALHQQSVETAPHSATADNSMDGADSNEPKPVVQHYGIICDSCDKPIKGVRYKCGNCEDFDLCEWCEAKIAETKVHDPNHVFIKLRRPAVAMARRKSGRPAPLLKRPLYPTEEDIKRLEEKILRKHDKHRKRGEKHEEKLKRREEKLKRRHEVHRDTPSKKEKLDPPHLKGFERIDAEFVEDENFPDGSRVVPNRPITKRWVMKNTGLAAWDDHTKLSLMWGNIPVVKAEVDVPHTNPNDTCTISVHLVTPAEPGVYQSHWRMSHRNVRFGHRVWCSILVVKPRVNTDDQELSSDEVCALPVPEIKMAEVQGDVEEQPDVDKDEQLVEDMIAHAVTKPHKEKLPSEVDILSAQDILSFEMLDIRDRNTPKVSQTATPTNTPMAVTPPKSPTKDLEDGPVRHMSTSSSVEIVSESSEGSTSHMTELVQERIAKLGLKPDHLDDLETISTCSEDSNDSESDFYIVPLPDCFNPNLPMSTSTSSVVMTREEVQKTVDDILMASKSLDTPSLVPSVASPEPSLQPVVVDDDTRDHEKCKAQLVEMAKEDTLDDVSLLAFEIPPTETVAEREAEGAAALTVMVDAEQTTFDEDAHMEVLTDENANSVPTTPESTSNAQVTLVGATAQLSEVPVAIPLLDPTIEGASAENPISVDAESQDPETQDPETRDGEEQEARAERPGSDSIPIPPGASSASGEGTPPSPTVIASSLMTAALGVASQAAATAYTTAKDVFHTLQANNQYVPPKSNWKPPQQTWAPPKQDFTLPKEAWTPPPQTWTPPEPARIPDSVTEDPSAPPTPAELSPMEKLVEMGFANRELNRQLLAKHAQDVQKVVQELVSSEDNDWHQQRH